MISSKAAAIIAMAGLGLVSGAGLIFGMRARITAQTIASGAVLYTMNCASCHGAKLEGQADWQSAKSDGTYPAPPHDESGHTWHHGDAMLTEYITIGGQAALTEMGVAFQSGMPAFGETLEQGQIAEILAYIRSTWPERAQAFQTAATENEKLDQP